MIAIFGHDMLDDETQCDGFAALCGLREHKPFECVGEIAESAAVMAQLGHDPDWRNDAVVRRLHAEFRSLQKADPARLSRSVRGAAYAPASAAGSWPCSMRAAELGAARVAIWGLGREGRAAIKFLRARHPKLPLLLLDDAEDAEAPREFEGIDCAFGAERIADALGDVDVIVKSPGVSLYRGEIETARRNGAKITSLLNLWFAESIDVTTICVTGTKGKSTTASLIAHMLGKLGHRAALVGNIGVPITEVDPAAADYAVIEVSSYQAADFDGLCDVAVLTSLFPEHLDWHRTLEAYYRDKLNLLRHGRHAVVNREAVVAIGQLAPAGGGLLQRRERRPSARLRHLRRSPTYRRSSQSLSRQAAQCFEFVRGLDRRETARHRPRRRA